MLLFYLDEYGNTSVSSRSLERYPFFVLGSMCIASSQRWSLYSRILELKDAFFPGWRQYSWKDSEIKGTHLAGLVGKLTEGKQAHLPLAYQQLDHPQTLELIDELFLTIDRFTPNFYFVAIEKQYIRQLFVRPTSPYSVGLVLLQWQVAKLAEQVYGMGEGAIFIADEQNQHENIFRNGEVRRVWDDVQLELGTTPDLRAILEKPLWVNSNELTVDREILQLTDLALYVVGRAVEQGRWTTDWFNKLHPHIARNWNTGNVWEGGITIFPRPASYPAL